MTNTELLAKIKAEIERQKGYYCITNPYDKRAIRVCENLLSFLSTLESEKPTTAEGLEEELKDYLRHYYNCDYPKQIKDKTCSVMMIHLVECARHFAKWGAEHTPLPEDTVLFNKGVAEGKRLMMKESVEGEVVKDINNKLAVTAKNVNLDKFKFGDKVRIIIVKEDEK